MRLLFASLVILMLAAPVAGHELSVYTVMVNSEGAHPADIPNGSLKEGDAAWFWMKDSTNNTTLVVQLEHEGASMRSPVLHYECEMKENGTELVDENCKNRFDYTFNQMNSAGLWNITFLKYVDNNLTETINGSVYVLEDVHDDETNETIDDASTKTDLTSKEVIAGSVATISLIAFVIIYSKMDDDSLTEEE